MADEQEEAQLEDPKQLKDFWPEVSPQIESATKTVEGDHSALTRTLEQLMALEKKTRLAADARSTTEICLCMLRLCFKTGQLKTANEYILLLCKRRAQLKKAVQAVVQEGMKFLETIPEKSAKLELIDALRSVSAGKIYVELECARLTHVLAQIKEQDGNIAGASDLMQDIQIETLGSMERREKADFLLEQMRLSLDKKDFIRAELVAQKIGASKKMLQEAEFQDLKLKYETLQIRFFLKNARYLDVCKSYRSIFDTPITQQDPAKWMPALRCAVMFCVLAPYDAEQYDATLHLKAERKMEDLPSCKAALDAFTLDELMAWPLPYEAEWKADSVFRPPEGDALWADLKKRVIQHNIRVISKYYSRIASPRLAQLLNLSEEETEQQLSELVSSKQLYAKMDRPKKIVVFARKRDAADILNDWSSDLSHLLSLVDNTCHLIERERLQYKVAQAPSS